MAGWAFWVARASWPAASAPGEHAQRIGQHGPYVPEHGRPGVTVDDAVVEGQRQRGHLAHRELSLVHPWRILDQAEREDRRLAGGQDGGSRVDPEDAPVGAGARAAAGVTG